MTKTQLKIIKKHAERCGRVASALKCYKHLASEIVKGTDYLIALNMISNDFQLEILEIFRRSYETECDIRRVEAYTE